MNDLSEYLERKASLEAQIAEDRLSSRGRVLAEVVLAIQEFEFSMEELFRFRTKRKAMPRYFDPVSGAIWSGRGREPHWIRGKDRRQFELTDRSKVDLGEK
ncbi:H-NS family nucleoid-associated regulatory protein [Burkholderia territorii]|uniref:H-NS histone family protein n=1 Tax=Burkholderia territorii TaxID=1503055 RepID=UPI0009BD47AA|nr:H-NS histone family protein [Burkholderia territorii]